MEIRTERLVMREWREDDLGPFAGLNADPAVMEHFEGPLSREASDHFVHKIRETMARSGVGLWAVEVPGTAPFIGFVGLWPVGFEAHFTPAIEIGWRLDASYWGRGYATEAGRATLADGFTRVGLDEVVSFAVPANERSTAVMRRLGMTHDPEDDFHHPAFPVDHPLSHHVLYRLSREAWEAGT